MLVRTSSLTKRYGPVTVLDRCDLEVRRGEVLGLSGAEWIGEDDAAQALARLFAADGRAGRD